MMKPIKLTLLIAILLGFSFCNKKTAYLTKTHTDANGFKYEKVTNDPLNARIYTLDNGLKVYLSQDENEPRIQTYIAVKAGSTYDPPETTGLAHYLEHMLFKGSSKIGTQNWEEESKLLSEISDLYEQHKATNDLEEKKSIYQRIDSVSTLASNYALPNEYDKLISLIGGKSTNAYTSNERTVYMNDIPANQLENWLKIEQERFNKLVLRLFHTELETVYEEFNMVQDNDGRKVNQAVMSTLFANHPYGTQTTIGEPEHLKNPSMINIHNYFDTYYVPNNMAICMSGDLDFEETVKMINSYFGDFEKQEVPENKFQKADKLTENVIKEVVGPDAESINISFPFDGIKSDDRMYVTLIDQILSNRTAGLIDLNLVQQQKVLYAGSYSRFMQQYGMHTFYAGLREGQSFEQVKDLLLGELDKIKTGDFDDWLIEAAIRDIKLRKIQSREYNSSKAHEFVSAFTDDIDWKDYIAFEDQLETVSKEDLVKFANDKYKYYAAVYKKTGSDTTAVKIDKPHITAINLNRDDQSDFFTEIENSKTEPLEPVWLDYKSLIYEKEITEGLNFNYIENTANELFFLYYVFEMGKKHNKKLPHAISYLDYLGTDKYDAADIRREFYKLGVRMSVTTGEERSYVYIMGLDESAEKAIELFEHLINNVKPDAEAYKNYVDKVMKNRADAKLSNRNILWGGILNHAQFGENSSFRDILSEEELKTMNPEKLTELLKSLSNYEHRVFYYGPKSHTAALELTKKYHKAPDKMLPLPEATEYQPVDYNKNKVFLVDYDMVQSNVVKMTKDQKMNTDIFPQAVLFGEYFGGGLSSIVFQEIREARGLAYSAFSAFTMPSKKEDYHFNYSYIATQPDKLDEATSAMLNLLNNMPKAEIQFNAAKEAVLQKYQTERITKTGIYWSYLNALNRGYEHDIRQDIYKEVQKMTLNDLEEFFKNHIYGKKYHIYVLGNIEDMDKNTLSKLGELQVLSLEDLFNY